MLRHLVTAARASSRVSRDARGGPNAATAPRAFKSTLPRKGMGAMHLWMRRCSSIECFSPNPSVSTRNVVSGAQKGARSASAREQTA